MPALEFSPRAKSRRTISGGRIREWRSTDGRYLVAEIYSPGIGKWFRAIRCLACGQLPASESRHKTREAAIRACRIYREQ